MRRWLCLALLLAGFAMPEALAAVGPGEMLSDPAKEERARELGKQLRCLVCQNQSIDDSDAELAQDLRRLVRERIEAGESDQEILAYLSARYGDFVLLKPPMGPATLALWFGPALVLVVAGAGIAIYIRRSRSGTDAPLPLSSDERERLAPLMHRGDPRPH